MSRRLWPFSSRTSVLLTPVLLIGLLIVVTVLREVTGWPRVESDKLVLIGIFTLSVLPILLAALDAVAERGGVIVIVIDLKDGTAWWETRLLILLAGAVRLRRPSAVVFTGIDAGVAGSFLGWAIPDALFPVLLKADERYEASYYAARAAANQWALVEPASPPLPGQPPNPPLPVSPIWVSGLGARFRWMALRQGSVLPNDYAIEQFLAVDLGNRVENVSPSRGISLTRLEELFRPVLRKRCIDETWPNDRKLEAFLGDAAAFVAIALGGRYQRLLPRVVGLNAVIQALTQRAKD